VEFLNSIKQVKSNWVPYTKWSNEQDDKDFQRQELYKKVQQTPEELERASQYGRTIVDAINTMDQYSVDKAEDVEMASQNVQGVIAPATLAVGFGIGALGTKTKFVQNLINKCAKSYPKHSFMFSQAAVMIPAVIFSTIVMSLTMIKAKAYEKEASRVARFQSREHELNDPKKFVLYSKEQIEEAKQIAKTLPDIPEKNKKSLNPLSGYSTAIKSIKQLTQDHDNYLKWRDEHKVAEKQRMENLEKANISPEELKAAKTDQDNLSRTVKKVELYSQNYLANTDAAISSVLGLEVVTGGLAGGIVSGIVKLLQKTKILSANSSKLAIIKVLAPVLAPAFLCLGTSFYSIKAKKEAARVGRFKAKQELLSDPRNFINYNDEQMQSVKDLKAPKVNKGLIEKAKDNVMFFFQLMKDVKKYDKYQKTEGKEELKLDQALLQVKVSDKQVQDAKSLQKNSFRAFEKIDEMAQRYSDDTEAATNIVKQAFAFVPSLGFGLSALLLKNEKVKSINNKYLKGATAAIPAVLSIAAAVIMEIKSAQIRKKAAQIGVMEAIQGMQDPKMFINKEDAKTNISKSA